MKFRQLASRTLALTGLVVLTVVILIAVRSVWALLIIAPLIILLLSGLKPPRRWGGWAAVAMVPYLCVALGELIADPANRPTYSIIVGCTLIVFFAAMDFVRNTGTSLRR